MNICPNCNKKSKHSFCPDCGAATTPIEKKRRLITVSGIICALILLAFVVLLPVTVVDEFVHDRGEGFVSRLTDSIAAGACLLVLGIWLWGMIRWTVFAVPHTYRSMKSVVSRIIPLSFFAVIAEFMFGIWLTLLPIVAYGVTTGAITSVAFLIRDVESLFVAILLFALSAAAFLLVLRKEISPIVKFFRERKAANGAQI